MTADAATNEATNIGGTNEALMLAADLQVGCFHHVSSVAVAGDYKGTFTEDMFDEGQHLPSAYHATKFEAEKLVRQQSEVPWRVYRPAIVVGHSETGEMDKVDGPYYFFPALARLADLPSWLPLVGPGPRRHQRRTGRLRRVGAGCADPPRRARWPRVPPGLAGAAAAARRGQRLQPGRRRARGRPPGRSISGRPGNVGALAASAGARCDDRAERAVRPVGAATGGRSALDVPVRVRCDGRDR